MDHRETETHTETHANHATHTNSQHLARTGMWTKMSVISSDFGQMIDRNRHGNVKLVKIGSTCNTAEKNSSVSP